MWYIVQTLKGKEISAAECIRRDVQEAGEEAFVLENERMYKIKKEWIKDRRPMFPGYVFVQTGDPLDFDLRLRKKLHPLKLLRMDDIITPIYPEEEQYLRRIGGEEHIARYSEGFRTGDEIVIETGAFRGFDGEVRKIDRHKRLAVIGIPLLGKVVDVTIGLGILKKL